HRPGEDSVFDVLEGFLVLFAGDQHAYSAGQFREFLIEQYRRAIRTTPHAADDARAVAGIDQHQTAASLHVFDRLEKNITLDRGIGEVSRVGVMNDEIRDFPADAFFNIAVRSEEDHEIIVGLGDASQPVKPLDYRGSVGFFVSLDSDVARRKFSSFGCEQEIAYGPGVIFRTAQVTDLPAADFLIAVLKP